MALRRFLLTSLGSMFGMGDQERTGVQVRFADDPGQWCVLAHVTPFVLVGNTIVLPFQGQFGTSLCSRAVISGAQSIQALSQSALALA